MRITVGSCSDPTHTVVDVSCVVWHQSIALVLCRDCLTLCFQGLLHAFEWTSYGCCGMLWWSVRLQKSIGVKNVWSKILKCFQGKKCVLSWTAGRQIDAVWQNEELCSTGGEWLDIGMLDSLALNQHAKTQGSDDAERAAQSGATR